VAPSCPGASSTPFGMPSACCREGPC
jgi:hypothetical protein